MRRILSIVKTPDDNLKKFLLFIKFLQISEFWVYKV